MADLGADDLLDPSGRLIPKVHFPGQSLTSVRKKLAKFIELAKVEGAGTSDVNAFAMARSYERAFDQVYQRLIVVAADVSADEGRRAFLAQQLAAVEAERNRYSAEADTLLNEVEPPAVYPVSGESRTIPIVFTGPCKTAQQAATEADIRRRWRP